MAQCKLTPREFIINTFSPQIAAICSNNAEATCQKNNLSFTQLLQPFRRLHAEGCIKDPQGTLVTIHSLQISVKDINICPPEPTLARKLLIESVSSSFCERTTSIEVGKTTVDIPVSVSWFEAWRETLLNVQFPSDHEFTKHFLACMIVVSTADDNPKEKIQQISTQLNQCIPGKSPKWFNNNTLRYYILIHDVFQDDKKKAEEVFTDMKNTYGTNNCFLLQMNSRPPGHLDDNTHLPDPWSQFISKHIDTTGSDQNSSPRTPVDTAGVAAMPSEVVTEPDKLSHAGTPNATQNPISTSDSSETVNLSANIIEDQNIELEVGQEATQIPVHPLSPDNETFSNLNYVDGMKIHVNENSPINANVWADSPSQVVSQHGTRLSTEDLEQIRIMISEFCLKSLLPYVEKQISLLNDVISNKKGVSRSLFSATKRWFGTNKPGIPGSTPSNAVIYTTDSPELQLRRLGDLCFMFGHYSYAFQAYHNAKRDFAADQAWIYYAGALEMAALSAFMMDEVTRKTIEYMDEAIVTYSSRMPQFATRATLLSVECLKSRGLYGEAAKQLIRMTSEDSDLRSALLLEQSAYCFIYAKMIRKYAFHIVLAGHRFSKAGQKKHSLRCYQQAHQVYNDKGWSRAEDHIYFTIGRQAASLKLTLEAAKAFEKLLSPSSKQPALQQAAFLREFLYIQNQLTEDGKMHCSMLPILPLPLVDGNQIKVLYGIKNEVNSDNEFESQLLSTSQNIDDVRWAKLEEILVAKAQGSIPMIFRPTIMLHSNLSNNSVVPKAVNNEPVYYLIELFNPLQISLTLTNLTLLWIYENEEIKISNEAISNSDISITDWVDCQMIDSIVLLPTSNQCVRLYLIPKKTGHVKVLGIMYNVILSSQSSELSVPVTTVVVRGKRIFEVRGQRLKNVKEKPGVDLYGADYRLHMNVVEKAPFLKVTFSKLSPEMLCGEVQSVKIEMSNIGSAPLSNIHIASTNPQLLSLQDYKVNLTTGKSKRGDDLVTRLLLPASMNDILQVGASFKTVFWIRAPYKKGNHQLDLLFYYENPEPKSIPKYRVSRHTWHLTVVDSIQISAITRRSAKNYANLPTLNLTVHIKNTNQVHDPFANEIELTNISLYCHKWSLLQSADFPIETTIQPLEMIHFLLKLSRKSNDTSEFSDIPLTENFKTEVPFVDFVKRRNILSLECHRNEIQQPQKHINEEANNISVTMKLNAALIIRWQARVMEGKTIIREAIGQHHIDLEVLNTPYNHPNETRNDRLEINGPLKIFGPDVNIPERKLLMKREQYSELYYWKNVISYSLSHSRYISHDFAKNRLCIIPTIMLMQNNSHYLVMVQVDTIGTSSQMYLQSIKSQVYSPQASTYFRYIGHTAIKCQIEPFGQYVVKLQAILPASGTYDLASRIRVSVKSDEKTDFVLQEWHMESVCVVNDLNISNNF